MPSNPSSVLSWQYKRHNNRLTPFRARTEKIHHFFYSHVAIVNATEETRLRNSGLYRIVRYRYIGVNQTFHEQHNIHHTRSNENDNIGKSPDYG